MSDTIYKPPFVASPVQNPIQPERRVVEWLLLRYGTRIIGANWTSVASDSQTVYTVPDGKEFYLLSAQISVCQFYSTTQRNSGRMIIILPGSSPSNTNSILYADFVANLAAATTASFSPCIPLKLLQGERIDIYNNNAAGSTTGSIVGYEIDSQLIASLLDRP